MNKQDDLALRQSSLPPAGKTRRSRYFQTLRGLEHTEAMLETRRKIRQQNVEGSRERHLSLLDARSKKFAQDDSGLKARRLEAKLDIEAAMHSLRAHCAEIGVQYVPGSTTAEDLLTGTTLEEALVAHDLDLPLGLGFSDRVVDGAKILLTVVSLGMCSLNMGLNFRLLDKRDLFGNLPNLGVSVVLGSVMTVGLFVGTTVLWGQAGVKSGAQRPHKELLKYLSIVVPITIATTAGLATFDAKSFILLNEGRAAIDPTLAYPPWQAGLLGTLFSGAYVLGLSATAYSDGYKKQVRQRINGIISKDKAEKREKKRLSIAVRNAIEALAELKIAETRLHQIDQDIVQLDQEFRLMWARMNASIPQIPDGPTPDEELQLDEFRERVRSAKTEYESYLLSRGIVEEPIKQEVTE